MGEWPADEELRSGDVLYRLFKVSDAQRFDASEELKTRFGLHWLQPPPGNYRPAKGAHELQG